MRQWIIPLCLTLAAILEVGGDACIRAGLREAAGARQIIAFIGGTVMLGAYGFFVNASIPDFGKTLGMYVVIFFVTAQLVDAFVFGNYPTKPIIAGGCCIVAGGIILTFWRPAV